MCRKSTILFSLMLLTAISGLFCDADLVYAHDNNVETTSNDLPKAVVTKYITLNLRHFHPGIFGSDPSFTFKSEPGDVYYTTGVSFPEDGTFKRIKMYGKFLHDAASNAEKVFVRFYSINQDSRTLLATVKSNYNASNLNFRWIFSSPKSTRVFAGKPYYVTLFMPPVGAGKYEISAVRIEYETGSP